MQYISYYDSPLGEILLSADDQGLTGLWLEGQRPDLSNQPHPAGTMPVLDLAKAWLDLYFSGREPDISPPLHLVGTPFQQEVWAILRTIPYAHTTTYGAVARQLAQCRGIPRMSAQAVGSAVGRNPISIIVPCHRVIGTDGNLTGYAGGIDRKIALLTLEGIDASRFSLPKETLPRHATGLVCIKNR